MVQNGTTENGVMTKQEVSPPDTSSNCRCLLARSASGGEPVMLPSVVFGPEQCLKVTVVEDAGHGNTHGAVVVRVLPGQAWMVSRDGTRDSDRAASNQSTSSEIDTWPRATQGSSMPSRFDKDTRTRPI